MSYDLNKEYRVQRVDDDTPCSLSVGSFFTIKEVIPKKYKIVTELSSCERVFTGAEIDNFARQARAGGGGKRSKKRSKKHKSKRSKKRRRKRSKK